MPGAQSITAHTRHKQPVSHARSGGALFRRVSTLRQAYAAGGSSGVPAPATLWVRGSAH